MSDIRWKQRFQNFEKAFVQLQKAVDGYGSFSDLEKEGLIQRFEYTFELAWKTMKDFLEHKGFSIKGFPRDIIKNAFQNKIIENGDVWLNMLEKRNLLAHTYDEKNFKQAIELVINHYYSAIKHVYEYLKQQL